MRLVRIRSNYESFSFQCRYYQVFAAYTGCHMVLVVATVAFYAYIAPATASSGIPKVKAYFHGVDAPSILVPITCFAKVSHTLLSDTVCVHPLTI